MMEFLRAAIKARPAMPFIGATVSGKTTVPDVFASDIDPSDRVVTIEDTMEFRLEQPHVVRLLTRRPNVEGKGAITATDLFRTSLRMRPNRILLGEIRGREALEYLQAINSGHGGTLAVIHAGTPEEALVRLEYLVAVNGTPVDPEIVRRQIAHGLQLVALVSLLEDGTRRITRIAEVGEVRGDAVEVHDVFRWETTGRSREGQVLGRFNPTGYTPKCARTFTLAGVPLPEETFEPLA